MARKNIGVFWACAFFAAAVLLSSCGTSEEVKTDVKVETDKTATEPMVTAVFSKSRLEANKLIHPAQIEVRKVPVSSIPDDAKYAVSVTELVDAISTRNIGVDTLLLRKMWTYDVIDRLSELVSPGKVAIAIKTDQATAMAFIAPNDSVDLLASFVVESSGNGGRDTETRIIAVGCRVLGVDRHFLVNESNQDDEEDTDESTKKRIKNPYEGRDKIRSVTIEVLPEVAQKVAFLSLNTKNSIRLAAHSKSSGVNNAVGMTVSSDYLTNFANKDRKLKDLETQGQNSFKGPVINKKLSVYSGQKMTIRHWSESELNAPYDEDGDAPSE